MKQARLYSVFVVKEGKNVRIIGLAFTISRARSTFQGLLVEGSLRGLSMNLLPVKGEVMEGEEYDKITENHRWWLEKMKEGGK